LAAIERAFQVDIEHPVPLIGTNLWKADEVSDSRRC
jgi:hypothetical protein